MEDVWPQADSIQIRALRLRLALYEENRRNIHQRISCWTLDECSADNTQPLALEFSTMVIEESMPSTSSGYSCSSFDELSQISPLTNVILTEESCSRDVIQ